MPSLPAHGMTPEEIHAWVVESRREQGLPDKEEDPAIVAKAIALLTARGWPPPWASQHDEPVAEAA